MENMYKQLSNIFEQACGNKTVLKNDKDGMFVMTIKMLRDMLKKYGDISLSKAIELELADKEK